ncbi:hypothetical protein COCNU_15G005220 [Cocos nucifera]|uniref:Uncharacterized protein n=1 Tax=Cocos nucifera TaxID=13894 RepID=A0A8K0IXY8_COCNU|nr:hypothetical protein COCNU_15G005220 [Cocos nucifera]
MHHNNSISGSAHMPWKDKIKVVSKYLSLTQSSAGVDVEVEGEDEDGEDGEEDESVDGDGLTVGPESPEVHPFVRPRELEQQPWRQQHEQNHPHHHRRPVRHLSLCLCV